MPVRKEKVSKLSFVPVTIFFQHLIINLFKQHFNQEGNLIEIRANKRCRPVKSNTESINQLPEYLRKTPFRNWENIDIQVDSLPSKKTSILQDIVLSQKRGLVGHVVVDAKSILNLETNRITMLPRIETNDQHYITEELAELVTHCTVAPNNNIMLPTKQEIYFTSPKDTFKATVFWIPNSSNKKIATLSSKVIDALCSKQVKKKMTRKKANGTSFEFGIGEQAGRQSSSISVAGESYKMPYIRNDLEVSQIIEDVYGPLEKELVKELTEHFPESVQFDEIAKGFFESEDSENYKPVEMMKSVQWPGTEGCLPFSQRSLRLNGNWKNIEWLNDLIGNGGSTLHCDSEDAVNKNGNYIFYFNPDEENLPGTDLLLFQNNRGGSCVRVKTMAPGWTCVINVMSTHILHASVFPNKRERRYCPNDFYRGTGKAFRVNCYTMRGIVKLACLTSSEKLCNEFLCKWKDKIEEKEIEDTVSDIIEGKPISEYTVWKTRHLPVYSKVSSALQREGI